MISIIIPTLNEEKTLGATLQRLRCLRRVPREIIVSDGGSTDATLKIARAGADRVVVHRGSRRQNIAQGRNAGARVAKGDMLLFLDADVMIPNPDVFISRLLSVFARDSALVSATVSVRVHPEAETIADRLFFGLVDLTHWMKNNVLRIGSASGEFQCIRTYAFRRLGGYNEALVAYEDNEMFMRLAKIGKTRMLSQMRVYHTGRRVHAVGHLKLLAIWMTNVFWVTVFKRAFNKEWKVIR